MADGVTPQLGCNYSPQLVGLLERGRAEVGWIKLSRWDVLAEELAVARPLRPVLLHVLPRAGLPSLWGLPWTWAEMNEVARTCGSPHVALHLASRAADWPAPPRDEDVVERLVAVTRAFAERLEAPLLVENVDYSPHDTLLRLPTDPGVVRDVCERAGVGMLLDLAHARIAAHHRGEAVREYLAALPLGRVREIHVCGPAEEPGKGLQDSHLEMGEEDYELLAWTLGRARPLVVTLEYGGTGPLFEWRSDAEALERQLARLRELCG